MAISATELVEAELRKVTESIDYLITDIAFLNAELASDQEQLHQLQSKATELADMLSVAA